MGLLADYFSPTGIGKSIRNRIGIEAEVSADAMEMRMVILLGNKSRT